MMQESMFNLPMFDSNVSTVLFLLLILGIVALISFSFGKKKGGTQENIREQNQPKNQLQEKRLNGDFLKDNTFLLVWIIINISIFGIIGYIAKNITVTLILIIIFQISTIFSLSRIGEKITRYSLGARPLKTGREKEILLSVFNLVYESVKEHYTISDDIDIYIEKSNNINAFALGRRTICITSGALQVLNENEIEGVLCHEFGHHVNKDTKMLLLLNCGGGIWSLFILSLNICNVILNGIINLMYNKYGENGRFAIFFINIIKKLLNLITKPIEWILMFHSRKQEFKADYVAYECGYGEGLIEGLYTLQNFSNSEPIGLFEKLKSSHPDLADRIERLENIT